MTTTSQRMPELTIGVSLKLYFGHAQTLRWCESVAAIAAHHPAITEGRVELFVIPSFPSIEGAIRTFRNTRVGVGAQDLWKHDHGAFTGEVSGAVLAELGVEYAELGHAERRAVFAETDELIAAKTAAAERNSLLPVLCVGEEERGSAVDAATAALRQVRAVSASGPIIVAWEPRWAIGASAPADPIYIREVCALIRAGMSPANRIIYGGSAGPGLLTELGAEVDGVFLGRFAHDPAALETVLDEALRVAG